jgi:hypothetical protein
MNEKNETPIFWKKERQNQFFAMENEEKKTRPHSL